MHRSAQVASAAGSRPLDGRTRRPDVPCSSRPCAGPRAARRVAVVCSSVAPIDPWEAKVQTPWTEPDPASTPCHGPIGPGREPRAGAGRCGGCLQARMAHETDRGGRACECGDGWKRERMHKATPAFVAVAALALAVTVALPWHAVAAPQHGIESTFSEGCQGREQLGGGGRGCEGRGAGEGVRMSSPRAEGSDTVTEGKGMTMSDTVAAEEERGRGRASSSLSGEARGFLRDELEAERRERTRRLTSDGFYDAGPAAPSALAPTPAPDYSTIDAKPWNAAIMGLFIRKLEAALGERTAKQGYEAVIELTKRLNAKYGDPRETHEATVGILLSLFPSWLPVAFAALFSRPMPGLSARLNALATQLTCEWLMGPLAVNDVVVDSGEVGKGHGLLVQRCRYLEQGGCASVCINSCKVPTQLFFSRHMGLPLTMTPNYDDYSCQFAFGKTPPALSQDPISTSPCFSVCPTKVRARGDDDGCHRVAKEEGMA